MFENNGSNALKPDSLAYESYEQAASEASERQRQRLAKRPKKRALTAQKKGAIMMATIAMFAMALTVLMFKAELNTEYKTLGAEKSKLSGLSSQVEQLNSDIEGAGSLVAVEEKAAELGLQQAKQSQIVYISLGGEDGGEILAEDPGVGGIGQFFNKIAAIAEYLY